MQRTEPDRIAAERAALDQLLEYQRGTLLTKCAGLTGEQLARRASPPSTLSLLGLLRHLTEVELWWFRSNALGEDPTYPYDPDQTGADLDDVDPAEAEQNWAAYVAEIDAVRAAMTGVHLDRVVPSPGHHPERVRDVRWIYLHVIEEYARHNGHADLLREAIDGTTGD